MRPNFQTVCWLTTVKWLTVNFPTLESHTELASRPTPSHLFLCILCPLSARSLTPTLFSYHSLVLSLPLLKTFSISTHTFSIKLAYQFSFQFFLFKQHQQEHQPSLPGYCTAHIHRCSLLLSSYISILNDSIPLSACCLSTLLLLSSLILSFTSIGLKWCLSFSPVLLRKYLISCCILWRESQQLEDISQTKLIC